MPINSYGLKTVANWLGFHWNNPKAEGAQALLWWRQWLSSKKEPKQRNINLRRIFKYNQDDCIATWKVAKWLMDN